MDYVQIIEEVKKRTRKQRSQSRYLLEHGIRIEIPSGKEEEFSLDRAIPEWSAKFQIDSRLYVCGG